VHASVILSSVSCFVLQYFPTLSHKRHEFSYYVIEPKTGVLIFSTNFFLYTSDCKKLSATNYHKYTRVFM